MKEKYSSQIQKIKAIQGEMHDAGIMLRTQGTAEVMGGMQGILRLSHAAGAHYGRA